MKIIMLYHPASEHARVVEEYIHDFTKRNPEVGVELLSVDTQDGARKAEIYDITSYPSLLALRDNGELLQSWVGLPLPLMNEVAYFSNT
jgi:hypothetical protein